MQFIESFEFVYIDIGTRYIPNLKTCSVYHWNQNRNKAENKCSSLHQKYLFICLFIFDYKARFVCVKDRPCLRIAITDYCFNIFGSIFSVLFCLLVKKSILGCKTVWQSMIKFPCPVWSVSTFPHINKEEAFFFLKTANWYGQNFLDNYLFIRSENLKTSLKI